MNKHHNHELLQRSIEIWAQHPHYGDSNVSLRGFVGVFHAVMQAQEKQGTLVGHAEALEVAFRYGEIDGAHHKAWVIDQMCRALLGDGYATWVERRKAGPDGPDSYIWDEGIAP